MRKSTQLIALGICLILCGPLLPSLAWVACKFMPPGGYTSEVSMELKPAQGTPGSTSGQSGGVSPAFIETQIQILQSKVILYPVIDELGLADKWSAGLHEKPGREETLQKLLRMTSVSRKAGTAFVTVAVTDDDRQEAADIANTIAVFYQKKLHDDREKIIDAFLSAINAEIGKQRQKVNEAEEETARIRIQDANPEAAGSDDDRRKVMDEEAKLNQARQKVEELKAPLDKIQKMSLDDLRNDPLAQFGIPDSTISEILPKYRQALADEESMRKQGLDSAHPGMKAMEAEIAVWKKQLDDEVDAIRKTLQARLDVAQADLDSEQKTCDALEAQAQQAAKPLGDEYAKAKQTYLDAKKLLDAEVQRYEAEKVVLHTETVPVKVWDRAEPARTPSRPDDSHIKMAATGFGILCALCGLGLVFMGLNLRRQEAAPSNLKSKI